MFHYRCSSKPLLIPTQDSSLQFTQVIVNQQFAPQVSAVLFVESHHPDVAEVHVVGFRVLAVITVELHLSSVEVIR
ncbi:hypothetical protein D3C84_1188300 [compost metagenome]